MTMSVDTAAVDMVVVVGSTVAVVDNRSEVASSWAAVAVVAGIVDIADIGLVIVA
jgi:hypothetical protein